MKLFIFDHCQYCVKARMIFGFKKIPVELVTLLNDDEITPVRLIGKKMVPILQFEGGEAMPESMDIVRKVDALDGNPVLIGASGNATLAKWLEQMSPTLYPLVMPRWVQAPLEEFDTELARRYFTRKKEAYIGPFSKHRANSEALKQEANAMLEKLAMLIHSPRGVHGQLSEDDLHLFSILRALSIVAGLQYPEKVERYRQSMSTLSKVPLHDSIAI